MKNRSLSVYAFAYLAFLYVPVLVLPIFSFNNSDSSLSFVGLYHRWYAGPTLPCNTPWATA
jgi:spermidine/putrescine transport system permease protein